MNTTPEHNPAVQEDPDETIGNVLSSIRRILHEEGHADVGDDEGELRLDQSMMVTSAPSTGGKAATTETHRSALQGDLMTATTMAAAERSMDALHEALTRRVSPEITGKTVVSSSSGLTIEDMVRQEVKDMVRTWLDTHLPSMVELMVRAEIAKLRPRD